MIGFRILIVLLVASITHEVHSENCPPSFPRNSAVIPTSKSWSEWQKWHRRFKQQARTERPPLVFLGDSITQGWTKEGIRTWNRFYKARGAANFGIAGDRTQHLLYRIQDGYFQENQPQVVVVMIGTNNIKGQRNTPRETVEGIEQVVSVLTKQLPTTQIILLGILPCGETASSQERLDATVVNVVLSEKEFGKTVLFLDLGQHFLERKGRISKEIMHDYLHLSAKGYQILANALEPSLKRLEPREEKSTSSSIQDH